MFVKTQDIALLDRLSVFIIGKSSSLCRVVADVPIDFTGTSSVLSLNPGFQMARRASHLVYDGKGIIKKFNFQPRYLDSPCVGGQFVGLTKTQVMNWSDQFLEILKTGLSTIGILSSIQRLPGCSTLGESKTGKELAQVSIHHDQRTHFAIFCVKNSIIEFVTDLPVVPGPLAAPLVVIKCTGSCCEKFIGNSDRVAVVREDNANYMKVPVQIACDAAMHYTCKFMITGQEIKVLKPMHSLHSLIEKLQSLEKKYFNAYFN